MKNKEDRYFKVKLTQKDPVTIERIFKVQGNVKFSESVLEKDENRVWFEDEWGKWVTIYEDDIYVTKDIGYSVSCEEIDSKEGSKEWYEDSDPKLDTDSVLKFLCEDGIWRKLEWEN